MWLLLLVALSCSAYAADGTFLGTIVAPPGQEPAAQGWIYVQGRNRMVRRVNVAQASIVSAQPSTGQDKKCSAECLAIGQEVRITAEQDALGEWRAKRVEILSAGRGQPPTGSRSTASQMAWPIWPHAP